MKFGDRLKSIRLKNDMTQEELGNLLNKSKNNISQYETGKREPDLETLNIISDYFKVSLDYLLGKSDDQIPVRNLDQDLNDELDTESKWLNFLRTLSGDSMFYQYENVDDDQKLAIMEEHKEKMEKKKKKVAKFMKYSDEVIDEALNFAAYNQEQRKKKLDD
ncbi:helix-turn-helix domain-containing protein [Acetobacterium woodii]|uniref:Transcriptional regulator n=1 Tax=Acetobacterium woodii (strain ATCC 29683 / DSM 1030 / JCM 2381 / KCTC 1655 / WB1) TaxID=931626 RepID=H6LFC0_ACEWD|nr:helix-turn-helix transcriptional regulator [Acetobacterium woodii]AFA48220.1 transcriptional regulator [Acetobacterium woodii DSM 1030]